MADYANFLALANRQIARKGMEMAFLQIRQEGRIDPVTGKRPVSITETKFMGLITRPAKDELAAGRFQNISQVALAPGDAIPRPCIADKLRFSGHEWEITEILEIAPAGYAILYKFGIRDAGLA